MYIEDEGNTGGYGLLTVFGVNFTRIVYKNWGVDHLLSRALASGDLTQCCEGQIWGRHKNHLSTFRTPENPWKELNGQISPSWMCWLLMVPFGRYSFLLTVPFYLSLPVTIRLQRVFRESDRTLLRRGKTP